MKICGLVLTCLFILTWLQTVPRALAVQEGLNYVAVMSGLPWSFRQTATLLPDKGRDGNATTIRYDFVSTALGHDAPQGKLFLKAYLTVSSYEQADAAASAWQSMLAKVHPDTGLTYAWDYLLLQNLILYHLHAACTFSEDNFEIIMQNLGSIILENKLDTQEILHCRCGGGCRISK